MTAAVTCSFCGNLNPADVACCLRCGRGLPQSAETRGDVGPSAAPRSKPAQDRADIAQFWVGSIINDRYRLDRAIGEGGNGVVFAGVDLHLGRDVALKVLHGDLATHAKALQRFKREALALARANHPNVVHIYDVVESRGQLVLVLELMRGGSLAARVHRGNIAPEEAVGLTLGILAGLGAIHQEGFVHRDLKPANVLLSAHGEPKVADLGVVHEAGGSKVTSTGVVIGTVAYMAPEQLTGRPVCPQTDLYAVGLILYELLSGREGFAGTSEYEVIQLHLRGSLDYSRLSQVPPELVSIIQRAVEKDVVHRFASAEEFAHALATASAMSLPPPGRLSNAPGYGPSGERTSGSGYYLNRPSAPAVAGLGAERTGPSGYHLNRPSQPTPVPFGGEPTGASGYYLNGTGAPRPALVSAPPAALPPPRSGRVSVLKWIAGFFAAVAAVPLLIVIIIVGSAIAYLVWRLYVETVPVRDQPALTREGRPAWPRRASTALSPQPSILEAVAFAHSRSAGSSSTNVNTASR